MRSNRLGWGLLAPTLVILGIFGVLPFIYVLYVGFFDWNPFCRPARHASATAPTTTAGSSSTATSWPRSGCTLKFAFFAVVSELILGYFLAQRCSCATSPARRSSAPFTPCR